MYFAPKVVILKARSACDACVVIFTVRFEEEILTSQNIDDFPGNNSADSKVIIGSNTFDHVQAQLNNQPPRASRAAAEVTTAAQTQENSAIKQKLTFSGIDHLSYQCSNSANEVMFFSHFVSLLVCLSTGLGITEEGLDG